MLILSAEAKVIFRGKKAVVLCCFLCVRPCARQPQGEGWPSPQKVDFLEKGKTLVTASLSEICFTDYGV